ncbi:hypothetical protein ACFE04_030672 [Oxalis oulophora]
MYPDLGYTEKSGTIETLVLGVAPVMNSNVAKKRRRKEATEKTYWFMDEYEINELNFQEWMPCRIKFIGKPNNDVPYEHYKVVLEQDLLVVNDQLARDKNLNINDELQNKFMYQKSTIRG